MRASGSGGRHRILRLRRQHRRDQHAKRIVLLIPGDLLDGGFLHAADRPGQLAHDRADGRGGRHYVIGVSGGWPSSTASTLRTASAAIALRVSRVALPRCGQRMTFSN
jgi:hypothetical protein